MKNNRIYLIILISSVSLLAVLIIQMNWIVQTAKIKEEIFNEKANIVLSKTAEALSLDTMTCKNLEACAGKNEIHKTDSLFNNYMDYYNFHIDYSFEVVKPESITTVKNDGLKNNIYKKRLEEEATKSGLQLNLMLPEKKHFLLAEMSKMFIASIVLIVIVLVLFWRTVLSLMKQKMISEHTSEFLNNMTHEFKTPLTNISLAGKMILKDSSVGHEEKIKHYSGIILEENEKLRLQVEQVLSMTALERGEIPLQRRSVDLHEVVNDALKHIRIQIEIREGNISVNLNAGQSIITGDSTHLTNAICNLIDNAIKYSKGKPDLTIQTINSGNSIVLTVADRGIGIEKEFQKKVFDKFFRVPTGDRHDVKGFGLGLAYIRKIIQLHGGTIALESEPGNGSSFIITIPNA